MSIELIVAIVVISTVAGTISAGISYFGNKQGEKKKKEGKNNSR